MLELAGRCEAVSGRPVNSRRDVESAKLDCEIWLAVDGLRDGRKFRKFIQHRKPGATIYGSLAARTDRGDVSVFASPSYTHSLDAAMSLVPEGLHWSVGHSFNEDDEEQRFGAQIYYFPHVADPQDRQGWGATPALALTAACLRALANRAPSHD